MFNCAHAISCFTMEMLVQVDIFCVIYLCLLQRITKYIRLYLSKSAGLVFFCFYLACIMGSCL